jgi:hypothetical protein
MRNFLKSGRPSEAYRNGGASEVQLRHAFESHRQELSDLALFLTGRPDLAETCIVDASAPSTPASPVFLDWLERWARHATIKAAIRLMHAQIIEAARGYEGRKCYCQHNTLERSAIAEGLQRKLMEATRLDPLARFALVLRGIEGHSVSESALLLEIAAARVEAAYCAALHTLGIEQATCQSHVAR